jgi:hypothetical protein
MPDLSWPRFLLGQLRFIGSAETPRPGASMLSQTNNDESQPTADAAAAERGR